MTMIQGAEASMTKVTSAGLRLSLLLNAAACQLAQSRIEIHSIAKGITLFASTLKDAGKALDATKVVDLSPRVTEKVWEIANQGQVMFIEIEHMLDKLQGTDSNDDLRRLPMLERLKWCFRKQHVIYLLACFESLKLSLIVIMRVIQLARILESNIDLPSSASPTADDVIAQEKVETQNMIIVRYWSTKRLDRMWEAVEQESMEAASDPTSQKINIDYYFSTATATVKPSTVETAFSGITKLPVVAFGDIDVGLSDIERSPKDMVHLSERAMNGLLSLWAPSLSPKQQLPSPITRGFESCRPQVYISSDNSDEDIEDRQFDTSEVRGYYLEGNTTDWRKPQSQQARHEAARLRSQYSGLQAHVESEPETDDSLRRKDKIPKSKTAPSSEDGERSFSPRQSSDPGATKGARIHSNSFTSGYAPHVPHIPEPKHVAFASTSLPPPDPGIHRSRSSSTSYHQQPVSSKPPGYPQQGVQQGSHRYASSQQEYCRTAPRSIPVPPNNRLNPPPSMPGHSPRGTPPSPSEPHWPRSDSQRYSSASMPKSRHHQPAYNPSSSSPESSFHQPPPRSSGQRSPSRSRRSSREENKDRNNGLRRSATRGLAGIGAIAGFMDALEAFQIL
ncbi:hypothetical protein N7466_003892 [Penicillium verhagenii]|uniref:uncharacterized protein n=1 Tax=Penicillium verhagenii TaxID=1562060 RepID=UPI0025451632|nr:uncharacterized protein N7466_003892 [Penicillium verhagenii]KAJ5934345.1 hypothetical protein N7466_003892 [Penicillium verhagenii]